MASSKKTPTKRQKDADSSSHSPRKLFGVEVEEADSTAAESEITVRLNKATVAQ